MTDTDAIVYISFSLIPRDLMFRNKKEKSSNSKVVLLGMSWRYNKCSHIRHIVCFPLGYEFMVRFHMLKEKSEWISGIPYFSNINRENIKYCKEFNEQQVLKIVLFYFFFRFRFFFEKLLFWLSEEKDKFVNKSFIP